MSRLPGAAPSPRRTVIGAVRDDGRHLGRSRAPAGDRIVLVEEQSAPHPTTPRWIWVAYAVLVALPVYAIAVAMCIRSGIFAADPQPLNDEQFKALWTFVAAALATSATILGALLTKSHNDRTLAIQAEAAARETAMSREVNERLKLETVVGGLQLVSADGKYSPKASIAGGVATLVQLGHPIVAIRTLAALMSEDAVDEETATWLLGQVLTTTVTKGSAADLRAAKDEAASLLSRHARKFTIPAEPGEFHWPDCVLAQWPRGTSTNGSQNLALALIGVLLSQKRSWWEADATWTWVIYTLDEAFINESNDDVRKMAATFAWTLLEVSDGETVAGVQDAKWSSDLKDRLRGFVDEAAYQSRVDAIRAWGEGSDVRSTPTEHIPVPNTAAH
jgi:hypothetical protein